MVKNSAKSVNKSEKQCQTGNIGKKKVKTEKNCGEQCKAVKNGENSEKL